METNLFDQTFRDDEGKVVIAQPPNLPVLVGITATILTYLSPNANLSVISFAIAYGALFTWAWQEFFDGVNYFRRALGLIALIGLVASRFYWS